jgi:hypothetical protein
MVLSFSEVNFHTIGALSSNITRLYDAKVDAGESYLTFQYSVMLFKPNKNNILYAPAFTAMAS